MTFRSKNHKNLKKAWARKNKAFDRARPEKSLKISAGAKNFNLQLAYRYENWEMIIDQKKALMFQGSVVKGMLVT